MHTLEAITSFVDRMAELLKGASGLGSVIVEILDRIPAKEATSSAR